MARAIFTKKELARYLALGRELIFDVIYDSTLITTGANDTLFQVPIGQTGNGFAVPKTVFHTNMETAGKLPNNEEFRILGYGMWVQPVGNDTNKGWWDADATTTIDFLAALSHGFVKIRLENKDYRYIPIAMLSNVRVHPDHDIPDVINVCIESPLVRNTGFLALRAPVHISAGRQIGVDVDLAAPPGEDNPFHLYFGFWGVRIRSVQ